MSQTSTSTPTVFISYRRSESGGHAGRLYDAMAARFGERNVFMDIDMQPGIDFVERITHVVGSCRVLLVVMAPGWALPAEGEALPRIADPDDFVRLEVATALSRPDVTVIPLLVEDAEMPDPDDLPEDLRSIARLNALELSDTRWRGDVGRLLDVIETLLAEGPHPVAEPASERAAGSVAAGAPGGGAPTPSSWLRYRRQIALGAVAVVVLLVVVVVSGGDEQPGAQGAGPPVTTPSAETSVTTPSADPGDRPVDVPDGCTNDGATQFARDVRAKTQWTCDVQDSGGVVGTSLIYMEYTSDADARSGLVGPARFQLHRGWTECENPDLERFYAHDATCLIASGRAEEDEGTIELTWHGGGSNVVGHMTFDPGTELSDGVQKWAEYV